VSHYVGDVHDRTDALVQYLQQQYTVAQTANGKTEEIVQRLQTMRKDLSDPAETASRAARLHEHRASEYEEAAHVFSNACRHLETEMLQVRDVSLNFRTQVMSEARDFHKFEIQSCEQRAAQIRRDVTAEMARENLKNMDRMVQEYRVKLEEIQRRASHQLQESSETCDSLKSQLHGCQAENWSIRQSLNTEEQFARVASVILTPR
jgi:chromosome segregation ATPase